MQGPLFNVTTLFPCTYHEIVTIVLHLSNKFRNFLWRVAQIAIHDPQNVALCTTEAEYNRVGKIKLCLKQNNWVLL